MNRQLLDEMDIEIRYGWNDDINTTEIIDRCIAKLQVAKDLLSIPKEGEDSPDVIENYHRYYFESFAMTSCEHGRLIFTQRGMVDGDHLLS